MTVPIVPYIEEDDHVMVDGAVAYEKMFIDNQIICRPIILAKSIVPFDNAQRTSDPDALVRGNVIMRKDLNFHPKFLLLNFPLSIESINEVKLLGKVVSDYNDGSHVSFYVSTKTGMR